MLLLLKFSLILFIFVNLTYQVKLVGYYINLIGYLPRYEYKGILHPTVRDMIKTILKERKIKNFEKFLIFPIGFKKKDFIIKNDDVICESVTPYLNHRAGKQFYEIKDKGNGNHMPKFLCDGKKFVNFESALNFLIKTSCYITVSSSNIRPKVDGKPPVPPKEACVMLPSGKKHLKRNELSYKVWYKFWNGCDESCYCENNFSESKLRYTNEINAYRSLFNSPPVRLDHSLNNLAQRRALELTQNRRSSIKFDSRYKELDGYSNAMYAKFYLKILFDDALTAKTKQLIFESKDIAPLMHRKTQAIGIGITNKGSTVFIVIICSR
uniref:SCP domain-containing protein n=1 Tax=Strongyloides stercoralis TaxID=6248 RepID=A0A0K0EL37_STRER